ncbi:SPOR domain-containing protein [Paludibacterium sp. B53371]|uniref:SPOR domain-containing protein n=1 Tax=Paludibacterium sp. B53371 TaxID=2806263 RepID=UPI001C053709|nr:SPOR domain-containing protein [Paludibacterium sp. B53371]
MKWFLGLVVALNLFVGVVALLRQHDPVDIHSHEVSPEQLKVLPAGWQPQASAAMAASAPFVASAPLTLTQTVTSPLGKAASAPAASAPTAKSAVSPKGDKPAAKAPAQNDKSAAHDKAKVASVPAAHAGEPVARQCAQWGGLSQALLDRVKGGLPTLRLKSAQMHSQLVDDSSATGGNLRYWVYIPAKLASSKLSGELAQKGFDNYVVQNEGDFRGALSLGLFGKQEGAQALVDKLKKAGYPKAEIQARGKTQLTRLDFSDLSDSQFKALGALQQRLTPGIALKTVACGR